MITRDEALVLLRSGQIPESRYVQLCDENGWELGAQLLNEAANALDDKDAEIERQRATIEKLKTVLRKRDDTIADLTAALQQIDNLKLETWAILEAAKIARAARARAQGGMR